MLEVHYSASCSWAFFFFFFFFSFSFFLFFISPLLFFLLPCLLELERTVSAHYGVLLSLSQFRWLSTCPPPALTSEVWSTYVPPVSPPSSPQEGKKASKEQKEKTEGKPKRKRNADRKKKDDEARTRLTSWRIAPVSRQGGVLLAQIA